MNPTIRNQIIAALLCPILAATAMAEGPVPLDLIGIRPVSARPSSVSKIKYRNEYGPGAMAPNNLQNLTEEQLEALASFLCPDSNQPPTNLNKALIYRLLNVLSAVDMSYKRAIAKEEWDRRIGDMQDAFTTRNGKPGARVLSEEEWEQSINDMLHGFMKKLDDPHAAFMDVKEAAAFKSDINASGFPGIGAALRMSDDGVKLFVFPDSPAQKAGLRDGDVITAIDGVPTKDQDLQTIIGRLRGPAQTPVDIRIRRLELPVSVTRAAIHPPDVLADMAARGIGYVYFSSFSDKIDEKIFTEINRLRDMGATKLIIDLRGNPGGLLPMADSLASEFLKHDDLIEYTERQGRLSSKALSVGQGRYYGMPLAIIINGYSASASEVLAAALKQHGKAIVVGSQSYGKGSFQSPIEIAVPVILPQYGDRILGYHNDGTMAKVTEGGWFPPDGHSIEGVPDPQSGRYIPKSGGIVPDEIVELSENQEISVMTNIVARLYKQGKPEVVDLQLDKAIEVLNRR
ncbi:MAG: S41 family peptidase [Elusimicrobiota bacterium]